jgi:hypothetical protein
MSTLPNPLISKFLADQNVAAPALGTNMAMPSAAPAVAAPVMPLITRTPTQTETDQTQRNHLISSGDGISQIKNPLLRGVARAADIAGSVFAPGLAMAIPGTMLHHNYLVNQATRNVAADQAQDQATANTADSEAQTKQRTAETAQALATTAALPTEQADKHNLTDAQIGNITSEAYQREHPIATNEFQLWRQQNPSGTAEDFQKLQSKPLSKDEASARNAVWDTIADKYHLPKGQFREGMSGADATALAGSLNQVIGRQQGAQSIVIRNEAAQTAAAAKAPLSTDDPAMQASVNGVANGSMKLTDVFGRGATTAQKAQFVAAVKAQNPNYNSGDHDIENSARRYMISGQGGQTLTAINTAYNHLDHLDSAAKAVNGGDVKALNNFANELGVQVQSGASPQVVFDLVKTALKGEMARAFTGAGATVDEQHALDVSFNNANSLPTLLAVGRESRSLLQGKEKSLRGQYDAGQKGQANFGALDGGSQGGGAATHRYNPATGKIEVVK